MIRLKIKESKAELEGMFGRYIKKTEDKLKKEVKRNPEILNKYRAPKKQTLWRKVKSKVKKIF